MRIQGFGWREGLEYPACPTEPEGMKVSMVQRADEEFPFLHDTMVVPLLGKLFMAWYNCSEAEIVGKTVIRGRWSEDGGKSWSEVEEVAGDAAGAGLHYVPVTFQEYDGRAWAYVTVMKAHDRPVGYRCRVYENGEWLDAGEREEPVLFNTLPVKTAGGSLIAAGRVAPAAGELPLIPSVMLAGPGAPAKWRIRKLPGPWNRGEYPFPYPETALIVGDAGMTAVVRGEERAEVFHSTDGGESWSGPTEAGFPTAGAKMYGGVLSDGKEYFIYNERNVKNDRKKLVMAVRLPGEAGFGRLYLLREGYDPALDAGPCWHYPCACERDGILYVSCTASAETGNVRHGILMRIPTDSL